MGWIAAPFYMLGKPFMKTIPQGAGTSVYAAVSPELESQSGAFLADAKVAMPNKAGQDMGMAAQFWAKTEEVLGAALKKAGLE